jgi:hypothetical protein
MRSAIGTLQRIATARLRRSFERRTGTGVYVREMIVDVSRSQHGCLVGITYVLGVHGPQGNVPVILDLRHCPFVLLDTSSNASLKPTQQRDYLEFVLAPGCDWEGAKIYTSFEWQTDGLEGQGRLLCLPEALPSLIRGEFSGASVERYQQPIIHIAGSAGVTNLLAGGIPGSPGHAVRVEDGPLVQAILTSAGTLPPQSSVSDSSVRFTTAFRVANVEAQRRLQEDFTKLLSFLGDLFGTPAPIWVVAGTEMDVPPYVLESGTLLILDSGELARAPAASFELQVEAARQLTRAWWGGGCRLFGARWKELEDAIGGAAAMFMASQLGDQTKFMRMLQVFKQAASSSGLRDQWHHLQGSPRPRLSARITLSLYEALQEGSFRGVMRDLVRANWGHFISANMIQEQLRKAGLDLDLN